MTVEEETLDLLLPVMARIVRQMSFASEHPEFNDAARMGITLAAKRIEGLRLDPGLAELLRLARDPYGRPK